MSEWMDKAIEAKQRWREKMAALPIEQKLVILEKLRDRARLIARNPLRKKYDQSKNECPERPSIGIE